MNFSDSRRKILLHLGGSKTGSTAIQNMLYDNRELLSEKSISYHEFSEPTSQIQSGNGQSLFSLVRNGGTKSEIRKMLTINCRPNELSIISSEFFQLWSAENWNIFFRSTRDLEIEVKLLLYIRPPIDFIVSSYIQNIKREGISLEFDAYLPNGKWLHAEALKNLCNNGHEKSVTVVNYEDNRDQLIKSFWENVSSMFDIDEFQPMKAKETISNRSLDQGEINFLREMNGLFGAKYSQLLSDFLIQEFPSSGIEFELSTEEFEILSPIFKDQILWVNQTFFEGKDTIRLSSNRFLLKSRVANLQNQDSVYPDFAVLKQVIFYLLRNIEKESNNLMNIQIANKLKQISEVEYLEEMDDGDIFDGVYYSLLNPDVITSNHTPLEHFYKWGKEEDRAWRKVKLSKSLPNLIKMQEIKLGEQEATTP